VTLGGDLIYVGDVHLDVADPSLDDFLRFLDSLAASTSRLVLMGDLFNVWIGQEALEQPHHRAVAARLAALRRAGVGVFYVEGNRDYRIARRYVGTSLDAATLRGFADRHGGHRIFAIHGDLANRADLQYRAWRRLSRSAPFWAAFNALGSRRRLRAAEWIERRMRRSNRAFKEAFPEDAVRAYGTRLMRSGYDTIVLGHFHVERCLDVDANGAPGRIYVLPEWRESRRHLRVRASGEIAVVDS